MGQGNRHWSECFSTYEEACRYYGIETPEQEDLHRDYDDIREIRECMQEGRYQTANKQACLNDLNCLIRLKNRHPDDNEVEALYQQIESIMKSRNIIIVHDPEDTGFYTFPEVIVERQALKEARKREEEEWKNRDDEDHPF